MAERFQDNDSYEKMLLSFRQGNQASLVQLYDQYAPALFGVVSRILENPELACDCLQHSFNEIWKQKASYDIKKERIFTWMMKIARNSALNFLKNGHSVFNPDTDALVSRDACTEVNAESIRKADDQSESRPSFSDADRNEVLHLVYINGFTFAEAASRLNITMENARSRFIYAVKQLKSKTAV